MEYRTLGSTGINVSVVGLGTWQFGGEWGHDFTPAEVDAIMGASLDEGINLIDTAECYGDHLSESLIGRRLPAERDKWIVATKFGHAYHGFQDRTRHWTGAAMREQLEASLRALGTDYVDLLQFHSPTDAEFQQPELWEALARVRREGLVRHIGLSLANDYGALQVRLCPEAGCEVLQVVYNRLERMPEEEILPETIRTGMGVLARVPLASGFLSGKYDSYSTFAENDWRSGMNRETRERMLREIDEIRTTELPEGAPMAEWALAWPLRHPAVSAVIPGCKSVEQVRANARACRWMEAR
ncbi:MAG: aldo/keto reductase [Spirochaetaceae bacterium]|nr:MAG: aldo/keto reductase [Spirochaetaceae bacterium]